MSNKNKHDAVTIQSYRLPCLLTRSISGTFDLGFGLCCAASVSEADARDGGSACAGAEREETGGGCKTSASELSLSLRERSFSRRVKDDRDLGRTMDDC